MSRMKKQYVLSVDQSTQGTKALLFDSKGKLVRRSDLPHRQLVNECGWISHDPEEIFCNLLQAVQNVVDSAGIDAADIICLGISNQRETSLAWNRETGKPVCNAIVWQCARSQDICRRLADSGAAPLVQSRTGIPLSPYFPASKFAWILENVPGARTLSSRHALCFGTMDTWLVYRLTNGACYKTDYSNASRTQLFNLHSLQWDTEICEKFGLDAVDLPQICDSDAVFGITDLNGFLPKAIPICSVLGDSHAALFGQRCLDRGDIKATYGTGSSVMMNIGQGPIFSGHGLVTSLAWKYRGAVRYVMEGNLNYTGAVIRWLQKDLGLIDTPNECEMLARSAWEDDETYVVPAFTGLGAPYWDSSARATICGITRRTGRAELVKAGLECIAYQIADVVQAMEQDTGIKVQTISADGGATKNSYLMQFQSNILDARLLVSEVEELSGLGAAYMAGFSFGIYDDTVRENLVRRIYTPAMAQAVRETRYSGWRRAVEMVLTKNI